MKICIVGHGPSLLENKLDKWIDSHDEVIRLKEHRHLMDKPEHFGTKRTVHGYSLVLAPKFYQMFPCKQWIFPDPRNSPQEIDKARSQYPLAEYLPQFLEFWHDEYRKIRERPDLSPIQKPHGQLSDELGHRHFSQGMAAIVYAIAIFDDAKEISLAGFDNVQSGTFTTSLANRPYDPTGQNYPDHNWLAEARLLKRLATIYNRTFLFNGESNASRI